MTTTTAATNPILDITNYQNTSPTTNTTSATKAAAKAASNTLGKNDFMNLLVTQLKNQDPLSPQDNQQMAAQMAQFSQLESLQNMQTSIDNLGKIFTDMASKQSDSASAVTSSSATALIGKNVRFKQTAVDAPAIGSTADLLVQAKSGSVMVISDDKGNAVRTIPLDGTFKDGSSILDSTGSGKVSWDGTDDNGKPAASGSYTVSVKDQATLADSGYAYHDATIDSVGFDSTGPILQAGAQAFRMKDLVNLKDGAGASTATASDNGAATSAALSMIGKTARFRDASADLTKSGASWNFTAAAGSIGQILDGNGNVVKSFSVDGSNNDGSTIMNATKGYGTYAWDGAQGSGNASAAGTYYLRIVNPAQTATTGTVFQEGTINNVAFDAQGSPNLVCGDKVWALKDLFTI